MEEILYYEDIPYDVGASRSDSESTETFPVSSGVVG